MNSLTSKRLEDIFAKGLEDVLKTSWRCLEDLFARRLENGSWRRLENVSYDQGKYIGPDQDVFWRAWLRQIYLSSSRSLEEVLKTSSEDEDERHLQDVFIKINVYWDKFYFCLKKYVIRFSPSFSTLLMPKKLIVMMRFYTSSKPFTNF